MERSTAPLKIADDAIIIDTSDLTIEEVMIKVHREIEEIIK
jgi:cytidylate kinase